MTESKKIERKGFSSPKVKSITELLMLYWTNEENKEKRKPIGSPSFKLLFGFKKVLGRETKRLLNDKREQRSSPNPQDPSYNRA